MDKKMTEMALGALLHDVGKLLDRSGRTLHDTGEEQFKYRHATWTSHFFNELGHVWSDFNAGMIEGLACYHHNPGPPEQRIVQQADWQSAGQDRRNKDVDSELPTGRENVPLVSIFSKIKLPRQNDDNTRESCTYAYPIGPETLLESQVMPQKNCDELAGASRYDDLCQSMKKDFSLLSDCPANLLVENVMSLCRKYMTFIPSSTSRDHEPDVSLYDHSLTTAAISCAMYAWHLETNTLSDEKVLDDSEHKFALIGGDLSGIQDFILDLPNEQAKGIAKVLRARSFYLSMLTRSASSYILDELNLPVCCRIKDAGGQFILLVHNTETMRNKLTQLRQTIDSWLLRTFHGKIGLNISEPLELCGMDFKNQQGKGGYNVIVQQLSAEIGVAKKRKFHAALIQNGSWQSSQQIISAQADEQANIHDQFVKLGSKLARRKLYIALDSNTDDSSGSICHLFGSRVLTLSADKPPHLSSSTCCALAINPKEYIAGYAGLNLAQYVPRFETEGECREFCTLQDDDDTFNVGEIKPFNVLAMQAAKRKDKDKLIGSQMLGIFKADVDRLGMLFTQGIAKDRYSIGRVTTFSRQLDLFFSGYLNSLLHNKDIYTEYAGGDDLLLIGPWNVILEFAGEFRKTFKCYVCNNDDIQISASVVFSKPSTPVSQSVRQAETLLKQAKDAGRNRICLLGAVLTWDEFDQAMKNGQVLDNYIISNSVTDSMVYRLINYHKMYQGAKKGQLRNMLWRSQLRYDLARNIESDDIKDEIVQMTTLSQKGNEMDMVKVSATYALYENRGGVV